MKMGLAEFNSIIRRAKQEEDFVKDVLAIMKTMDYERGSSKAESDAKKEAKEIAVHKWLPVVLALKHGLDINGSGGDSIKLDLKELAADANIQRDVMFVYTYLSFDDICPFGGTPSYDDQPVAPSPGAYNMWREYRFMENGTQEFMKNMLNRFGPSRNELDNRNAMSDDGQSLVELNKEIAKARREAVDTVAGYTANVN
jgi:hypothetical protein